MDALAALGSPYSTLRRSVVDPITGNPVVTSAPTGEVRQRSALLPLGRDDDGRLVPAFPQAAFDAIDAARFPGQVLSGEKQVYGPDGHVTDEAIGAAGGIAGLAMTGGLGGVEVRAGETALGGGPFAKRRLTFDSPLTGVTRITRERAEREAAERTEQAAWMRADPQFAAGADAVEAEAKALRDLLPKFDADLPRGRPFQPARTIEAGDSYMARLQETDGGDRVYRLFSQGEDGRPVGRALGRAEMSQHPDGRWETGMLEVRPSQRGKGVASALYKAVEADTGQPRVPSGVLLADGYAFWKARDPAAVAYHQPVGPYYLSPKRMQGAIENESFGSLDANEMRAALARVPPEGRTPEALARQFLVPATVGAGAAAGMLGGGPDAQALPLAPLGTFYR